MFGNLFRGWRQRAVRKEVAKLRELSVGDIMTKYVITVKPSDEVIKAATKMVAEDISCLVVVEDEKVAGILSERDFLLKVPLTKEVFSMKVSQVMTPNPIVVPPGTKLEAAVSLMKQHGFRRLVVTVDGKREGKLLGIVTQTDFTKTLRKTLRVYPIVLELTVGHIMSKDVITVTPKESVADAKKKMLKQDVGAIIIVDGTKENRPIGILTEYDIVMQFYDQQGKLETKPIEFYMRKYVRAVEPDMAVLEGNRLMLEKNIRRLLIVDGTKIAGIATQTDICRYMYTQFDAVLKAAEGAGVIIKKFPRGDAFLGEFRGEHLKVYKAL